MEPNTEQSWRKTGEIIENTLARGRGSPPDGTKTLNIHSEKGCNGLAWRICMCNNDPVKVLKRIKKLYRYFEMDVPKMLSPALTFDVIIWLNVNKTRQVARTHLLCFGFFDLLQPVCPTFAGLPEHRHVSARPRQQHHDIGRPKRFPHPAFHSTEAVRQPRCTADQRQRLEDAGPQT